MSVEFTNIENEIKCAEVFYNYEEKKIRIQCLFCDNTFKSQALRMSITDHLDFHLDQSIQESIDQQNINTTTHDIEISSDSDSEDFFGYDSNCLSFDSDVKPISNNMNEQTRDSSNLSCTDINGCENVKANIDNASETQVLNISQNKLNSLLENEKCDALPVVESSSLDNLFHCPYEKCYKTVKKHQLIRQHILSAHIGTRNKDSPEKFNCELCVSKFKTKYNLNRHINDNHVKPIEENLLKLPKNWKKCEFCNEILKSRYSKKRHELIHAGEKPYKCEYCGKAFTDQSNCENHIRTHTGEKKYKCNYCDKSFIQSYVRRHHELALHIKKHTIQCEICGKGFYRTSVYTLHMRRHTGEKPYKCNICLKTFYENSMLKNHLVVHTNEKNYECSDCKKRFATKKRLRIHSLTHSNVKKYRCEICNQCFAQSSGLYSHKKSHKLVLSQSTLFSFDDLFNSK